MEFNRDLEIRQALAKGVSDHQQCALDIDFFIFFEHSFGTFAMETNSTAMRTIFWKDAMETNSDSMLLELLFLG